MEQEEGSLRLFELVGGEGSSADDGEDRKGILAGADRVAAWAMVLEQREHGVGAQGEEAGEAGGEEGHSQQRGSEDEARDQQHHHHWKHQPNRLRQYKQNRRRQHRLRHLRLGPRRLRRPRRLLKRLLRRHRRRHLLLRLPAVLPARARARQTSMRGCLSWPDDLALLFLPAPCVEK